PEAEKRNIYARYIPPGLIEKFQLENLVENRDLLRFSFVEGSSDMELKLYHKVGFPDPILYTHLADSMNGQIFVLLYILNDPDSPRFDVDKMPDGSPTRFGIHKRNLGAERSAMEAGLTPIIVTPTIEMRATVKRWGWKEQIVGSGPDSSRLALFASSNWSFRRFYRLSWTRYVLHRAAVLSQRYHL
ncbi:MAG TPA: hypothetical protein PLM89_08485, partial [Anaerolineales bacterium]|nr:hypothetical protein [Anaerolineales bacterium]